MGFETRFNKFAGLLNYLTVHLIIALVVFLVRLGDKSFLTYYRSRIFAERRWLQKVKSRAPWLEHTRARALRFILTRGQNYIVRADNYGKTVTG